MGGLSITPPFDLSYWASTKKTMSYRSWVITLNNWSEEEWAKLTTLDDISYGVFGKEGKMGTPHIQAAVTMRKPITLAWWKKVLPRAHLEQMRARDKKKAFDYCKKEQDWIEVDNRKAKGIPTKKRIQGYVDQLKEGKSMQAIIDADPVEAALSYRALEWLSLKLTPPRDYAPWVCWVYGVTSTGKTTAVFEEVGVEAYWHKCDNFKWWSLYTGQEVVVLEELRASHAPLNELLRLFDFVPLAVETKGGHVHMRARKIYVTTPRDPVSFYKNEEGGMDESIAQLRRRVNKVMRCFVRGGEYCMEDMTQSLLCGEYHVVDDEGADPFAEVPFYVASQIRQPSADV